MEMLRCEIVPDYDLTMAQIIERLLERGMSPKRMDDATHVEKGGVLTARAVRRRGISANMAKTAER